MARRARCWQVHSALTQKVKVLKWRKVRVHAAFPRVVSGQLRFLGSIPQPHHSFASRELSALGTPMHATLFEQCALRFPP